MMTCMQGSTSRWLEAQPVLVRAFAVLIGTLILTAGSYITVPIAPVPITMQTFAVAVVGAVYGWRLGGFTVALWMLQEAMGMPVMTPGVAGGIARFAGPTAGYIYGFLAAAMMVGWLADRVPGGRTFWRALAGQIAGNLFILFTGTAWLAFALGLDKAIAVGAMPFFAGAVTKSVLGAAVVSAIAHGFRGRV